MSSRARHNPTRSGLILMEVILALSLFVVAGAVATSAMNSSIDAVRRLRMRTQAADLAVTKLSELLIDLRVGAAVLEDEGPEPFDDEQLAEWTWQIDVEEVEDEVESNRPVLMQLKVTIAHTDQPIVYRIVQWVPAEPWMSRRRE